MVLWIYLRHAWSGFSGLHRGLRILFIHFHIEAEPYGVALAAELLHNLRLDRKSRCAPFLFGFLLISQISSPPLSRRLLDLSFASMPPKASSRITKSGFLTRATDEKG